MATQPTPTLSEGQAKRRKIQVLVSEDSNLRIKVAAAVRGCEPGQIIDALASTLPPVPVVGNEAAA